MSVYDIIHKIKLLLTSTLSPFLIKDAPSFVVVTEDVKMKNSVNQSVYEFLEYYTDKERKLGYAVMLEGDWGVGKTYFIRSFLKEYEAKGGRGLFVSLYGMTSTTQIDQEFYRLLHPLLSSKGMKIAAIAARCVGGAVFKFDFLGKTSSQEVDLSIPNFNFLECLNGPEQHLLIFDDIERCKIPLSDIFGYINAFVEHEDMKVIVLGDSKKINGCEKIFYNTNKEKTIGQALKIKPDVESAYSIFVDSITKERVREFFREQRDCVLAIHTTSESKNLRILKQSMFDFDRISLHISEENWGNKTSIKELMKLCLALSHEIRSGFLKLEDLKLFQEASFTRYVNKQKNNSLKLEENRIKEDARDKFENKYSEISTQNPVFNIEVLGRIIIEGINDKILINKTMDESTFFAKTSLVPAWIRAWNSFENDDASYEQALNEVLITFSCRTEREPGIIFHIFGILLRAADIGAIKKTRAEVLNDSKMYIDELKSANRLYSSLEKGCTIGRLEGFGGLGFTLVNTEEFIEFADYYKKAAEEVTLSSYPTIMKNLLSKMEPDTDEFEFLYDFCLSGSKEGPYYKIPVFSCAKPEEFVDKVLLLSPKGQIAVFSMFKFRYQTGALNGSLQSEKAWLSEVKERLLACADLARPVTKTRLKAEVNSILEPLFSSEGKVDQVFPPCN